MSYMLKQFGFYTKSMLLFGILALLTLGGWYFWRLQAVEPLQDSTFDLEIILTEDGNFYVGRAKITPELIVSGDTYRYRYQVINRPREFLEEFSIALHLPKSIDESLLAHRFINNGGALLAESERINGQTVVYRAFDIGREAQLTFEIELPQAYFRKSATLAIKQYFYELPPLVWATVSIALPFTTLLLLLFIGLARSRKVPNFDLKELTEPPSRLPPVVLGILLRGRITSRELAATLLDLARRGHLIIRQVSTTDFRFSFRRSSDKLEDFEEELLHQIFGPIAERTETEEITFSIAQELFSKRISHAFILAYNKIYELGYFYTNPLKLHRRYQFVGIALFALGLVGFLLNFLILSEIRFSLVFWVAMMVSALMVTKFSRGLPVRSVYGDRELARWLAFYRYLKSEESISFAAHNQEKYLAYLPYAVVFGVEVEWTKRFYELPFTQPSWYVAPSTHTIDEFANRVFPLLGYLAHILSISAQPSAR